MNIESEIQELFNDTNNFNVFESGVQVFKKPFVFRGRKYKSIKEYAKIHGISYDSAYDKIKRNVKKPKVHNIKVTYGGKKYYSLRSLQRESGIPYKKLQKMFENEINKARGKL